jgi:hypothetical protein
MIHTGARLLIILWLAALAAGCALPSSHGESPARWQDAGTPDAKVAG